MAIRKREDPAASAPSAAPVQKVTSALGWRDPKPLEAPLRDGPPAPLDAFPKAVRDHIADTARAVQAPVDLCALSALTTLAAAAQRAALVRILPEFIEQLSLYGVGVARPSERKSAIHRAMTGPLYEWERQHRIHNADRILDIARERRLTKSRIKSFETALGRAKTAADVHHWSEQIAALERAVPDEVVPVQLTVDDITIEQMIVVLERQNKCIALLSDEAGTFQNMLLGRYDSTGRSDLDAWLKGYDGGRIQVERKKEDALTVVERPRITLGLFAQTGMLRDMATDTSLNQRGLIARICFIQAKSRVGSRELITAGANLDVKRRYSDALGAVLDLPVSDNALELEPDALAIWSDYYNAIERQLTSRLEPIEELAGKHPARAARVAAIWHLVRYGARAFDHAIDATTMRAAVAVAEWLLGHQLAIASWLYDRSDAFEILEYARKRRLTEAKGRDLMSAFANRAGGRTRDDARAGVDELVAKGWARAEPTGRGFRVVFHPSVSGS